MMAKTTAKMSEERHSSPQEVAETMLSWHNLELTSCLEMQSLWAGYGHICAIKARPSCKSRGRDETVSFQMAKDATANFPEQSFVLKLVQAPTTQPDEGHLRKMYSYEIEQHFYDEIAPTLTVSVAKCLASTSKMRETARTAELGDIIATLMTDLRLAYPVSGGKRAALTSRQVHAALRWLAGFHRCYWEHPAQDLGSLIMPPLEEFERRKESNDRSSKAIWLNGGYTYLATRRKEYEHLSRDKTSEWSALFCSVHEGADQSIAELVAAFLRPCGRPFETYLHGDVKSENMFFTESGDEVAFFDFQYVGIGLGVCDLAKLFTCSIPLSMFQLSNDAGDKLDMSSGEAALLQNYWRNLLLETSSCSPPEYSWMEFKRHWETALVDWCRFQASWGFWGNTHWLQARVRHILDDKGWLEWLKSERPVSRCRAMGLSSRRL